MESWRGKHCDVFLADARAEKGFFRLSARSFLFGGYCGHFRDSRDRKTLRRQVLSGAVFACRFYNPAKLASFFVEGYVFEFCHNSYPFLLSVFQNFFHGGRPVENRAQAVVAQGAHAELYRLLFEHEGRRARGDRSRRESLTSSSSNNPCRPLYPEPLQSAHPLAEKELFVGDFDGVDAEHVDDLLVGLVGRLASGAILRTSRCPRMPSSDAAMRKGSSPMSMSRVTGARGVVGVQGREPRRGR